MGVWAQRWMRDDLVADQNLDPDLLMWDIRRCVATRRPPADRLVVQFRFAGMPSSRRHYWLVFDDGEPDLCMRDPGFDIDLLVRSEEHTSELQSLMRISYAVFCLKTKKKKTSKTQYTPHDST